MFTQLASLARTAPAKPLLLGGLAVVCQLFSAAGYTQACVDTDGDGWGWNGSSSCLMSETDDNATPADATCVDEDGDGYGWNGAATCFIGSQSQPTTPDSSPTLRCVDSDGDGWGWNGVASCQVSGASASEPSQPSTPSIGNGSFNPDRDLVTLHFDHAPDRDDGHAAVAGLMVTNALQLNVQVVAGTHGVYSRDRYDVASESVMSSVWGSAWLNAHSNRAGAVAAAVNRWTSVLAAGGSVWVAEGGPADFTAAVVRTINANHSEFNTRERIHVIQHSNWNEDHSLAVDLAYAKANTRYVKIADGNHPNATADLRFENHNNGAFVTRARSSQYANEWGVAFSYLPPSDKLDFSDTVELLHIVGLGTNLINDVNDFGDYFF